MSIGSLYNTTDRTIASENDGKRFKVAGGGVAKGCTIFHCYNWFIKSNLSARTDSEEINYSRSQNRWSGKLEGEQV